jgi:hypothetical protein
LIERQVGVVVLKLPPRFKADGQQEDEGIHISVRLNHGPDIRPMHLAPVQDGLEIFRYLGIVFRHLRVHALILHWAFHLGQVVKFLDLARGHLLSRNGDWAMLLMCDGSWPVELTRVFWPFIHWHGDAMVMVCVLTCREDAAFDLLTVIGIFHWIYVS